MNNLKSFSFNNFINLFHNFNSFNNLNSFSFFFSFTLIFSSLKFIFFYWNNNLSFLLNIINIIDIKTGLLLSKLCYLNENNLYLINKYRKEQLLLPLGPIRKIAQIIKEDIQSKNGHKIPIQIFIPFNYKNNNPIIIYYHGGGFVIGSVEFYKPVLTSLSQYTGCIVIGIDYRKAPEYKFPAAPEDCIEATKWIIQNGSKYGGNVQKICILGDSAGGNLTAIVARELSNHISLSIPIYPVITFGVYSKSKYENAFQPILSARLMDWFTLRYFNSRYEMSSQLANAYYGNLTTLPRTHVITAEYDVLRDEGIEYYETLKSIGVNVTHKHYNNTVHGFFGAEYLVTHGKQSVIDVANLIKEHFQL